MQTFGYTTDTTDRMWNDCILCARKLKINWVIEFFFVCLYFFRLCMKVLKYWGYIWKVGFGEYVSSFLFRDQKDLQFCLGKILNLKWLFNESCRLPMIIIISTYVENFSAKDKCTWNDKIFFRRRKGVLGVVDCIFLGGAVVTGCWRCHSIGEGERSG